MRYHAPTLVSCPRNSYANFWDKQATKILIFLVSTLNLKSNGFQIRDTRYILASNFMCLDRICRFKLNTYRSSRPIRQKPTYARNTPPVAFCTAATIFVDAASISASVNEFSTGCRVTAIAKEICPSGRFCPVYRSKSVTPVTSLRSAPFAARRTASASVASGTRNAKSRRMG